MKAKEYSLSPRVDAMRKKRVKIIATGRYSGKTTTAYAEISDNGLSIRPRQMLSIAARCCYVGDWPILSMVEGYGEFLEMPGGGYFARKIRDKKKGYGLLRYVDGKYFSTVYFDSYDEAYIDALRHGEENCVIQHYDEYGCVVSQDVFKDMPTPY